MVGVALTADIRKPWQRRFAFGLGNRLGTALP